MKKEYDFKGKRAVRGPVVNPAITKVSKTIRIDMDIVAWLVKEADRTRIPYQTLINSILKQRMDESFALDAADATQDPDRLIKRA